MVKWLTTFCVILFTQILAAPPAAGALTADELLLVANRNVGDGVELARYYAQQRGVPAEQIIELDLPTGDDISIDDYEQRLADPIRQWLAANPGRKVRCVVAFFGVPFKIAPRGRDAAIDAEQQLLAAHQRQIEPKLNACVIEVERLVKLMDPGYSPPNATGLAGSVMRIRQAAITGTASLGKIADEAQRTRIEQDWLRVSAALEHPLDLDEPTTQHAPVDPATQPGRLGLGDPAARAFTRQAVRRRGVLRYAQVIDAQADYLAYKATDAAVDNELACLMWGSHKRENWQGNPLNYNTPGGQPVPPTIMTMRLDGPGATVVRRIIDDSIAVERGGLVGIVLLDSWNKPLKKPDGSIDGYGRYDEIIRRANQLLSSRGKLQVLLEGTDQLTAENSQKDIAVYCGWYNPNRVVIPGQFVRGAVGFHVASYTSVGLRSTGGGWWVPGLLSAGVCGTIGPVSEPYLTAFPDADEFLPLLMTGKLTLAEVWWKTNPMTSWKMLAIGDPLYTPFKETPAILPTDLPTRLQRALE